MQAVGVSIAASLSPSLERLRQVRQLQDLIGEL